MQENSRFHMFSPCPLLPPANEFWDKVMFPQACVILSTGGGWVGVGL